MRKWRLPRWKKTGTFAEVRRISRPPRTFFVAASVLASAAVLLALGTLTGFFPDGEQPEEDSSRRSDFQARFLRTVTENQFRPEDVVRSGTAGAGQAVSLDLILSAQARVTLLYVCWGPGRIRFDAPGETATRPYAACAGDLVRFTPERTSRVTLTPDNPSTHLSWAVVQEAGERHEGNSASVPPAPSVE
ncbi:hypothetical protein ACFYVL_09035 [Streptomyces sp. NPDC004111]|uniref:hypothetical protein n=1 Tax=Streptomyces sp. NPDC004111 TaxID=3364690 RepID=UPI0036878C20